MSGIGEAFQEVLGSVVAAIVMLVLAVLSFFLVVYVVSVGSGFAGVQASSNYVVLSASLIVSAGILAGIQA